MRHPLIAVALLASAAPLRAQAGTSHWLPVAPGKGPQFFNGRTKGVASFDDGNGGALYIGGAFMLGSGPSAIRNLARWDGKAMSAVGNATEWEILEFATFDDGTGAALYAAGQKLVTNPTVAFPARWSGTAWTPLGAANVTATCIHAHDDGGGSALYVGGTFTQIGSLSANRIARWNGSQWSAVGAGFDLAPQAMVTHDDGSGPKLYVGGNILHSGGQFVGHVVRWDGSQWQMVGTGIGVPAVTDWVQCLAVHDDGLGGGPALYAGGLFNMPGTPAPLKNLARWNGSQWSPVGDVPVGSVWSMASFDDGSGARASLFVGGSVAHDGTNYVGAINRWNGSTWSGLDPLVPTAGSHGDGMAVWDDGTGAGATLYFACGTNMQSLYGDRNFLRWGGCHANSAVAAEPGCSATQAVLSAPHPFATLGHAVEVDLAAPGVSSGLAPLYAGAPGTNASGCGLVLPGIGELLLAPVPAPFTVASAPVAAAAATYLAHVPDDASLVGQTISLQAVVIQIPSASVQLSTALAVTIGS